MSLTANPFVNALCTQNPRGGTCPDQKPFWQFLSVDPTPRTAVPTNENFSAAYIINSGAGAAAMTNLCQALGVSNVFWTGFICALGAQELWACRSPVPSSGLPPNNTVFVQIYWSGNDLQSSGNLGAPQNAGSGPFY
jgi:hypothetical protein